MAIEQSEAIVIRQVANGYLIMRSDHEQGLMVSDNDRCVFQSMSELVGWLEGHFTVRSKDICPDL